MFNSKDSITIRTATTACPYLYNKRCIRHRLEPTSSIVQLEAVQQWTRFGKC